MATPGGSNSNGERRSFYEVITDAIRDFEENGFDSQGRLDLWISRIREAALASLTPLHVLDAELRNTLTTIYTRMVEKGGILKMHPGVPLFTIDRVKPHLRAELDRRLLASANLIKLNRAASIETTIQRFIGWSTSIPAGGSRAVDRVETKTDIRKALTQLPYEERRVAIDQGHKLTASLSHIIAVDGGAIAAVWKSHFRQAGYKFRRDHAERDGHYYAVRGCWALEKGLMKAGPSGYLDEMTQPGEEVFCRCFVQWIYAIRRLPPDMLTAKGVAELERVRKAA